MEQIDQAPAIRPRPPKAIPKAIPESRDRWQSRALLALVVAGISACAVLGLLTTGEQGGRYKVAGISILFAILAGALRSATVGGAVSGALACFCLTWWTRDLESPLAHSALPPLIALFVLTFVGTRAGRQQKQARGIAERAGGRSAAQVVANLGMAALAPTPIGAWLAALAGLSLPLAATILSATALAALAEATADTVSSEIGQAFGSRTYMLTTLQRVHRGTDGGVSLLGTAAGASAALLVVLVGGYALRLEAKTQALALLAGLIGLLADSLLGATIERRGWIGNDVVNFTSTAVAAFSFLLLARLTSLAP